ncbi:hypothetical protein ACOME3_010149 [Neoechinorhynchus agilis]
MAGSQNIILTGRVIIQQNCVFRGDLAPIRVGKYCHFGRSCILQPFFTRASSSYSFSKLSIGDYTIVEDDCVLKCNQVGSCVRIGHNSVCEKRSILKDCSILLPNSLLTADTCVPPYCIFGGIPAKFIAEAPESTRQIMVDLCSEMFDSFLPLPPGIEGSLREDVEGA